FWSHSGRVAHGDSHNGFGHFNNCMARELLGEGIESLPKTARLFWFVSGTLRVFDRRQNLLYGVGAVGRLRPKKRRAEQTDHVLPGQRGRLSFFILLLGRSFL